MYSPGDQATVWIHQCPLPRADEECCSGKHADGLDQPVLAAYMRGRIAHHTSDDRR